MSILRNTFAVLTAVGVGVAGGVYLNRWLDAKIRTKHHGAYVLVCLKHQKTTEQALALKGQIPSEIINVKLAGYRDELTTQPSPSRVVAINAELDQLRTDYFLGAHQ